MNRKFIYSDHDKNEFAWSVPINKNRIEDGDHPCDLNVAISKQKFFR